MPGARADGDEALHRVRVLPQHLLRHDDPVAVEIEADVGIVDEADVVRGDARFQQTEIHRRIETKDRAYVAARQHGLAQLQADHVPGHRCGIEAGCLREGGEQPVGAVVGGGTDLLAGEISGLGDTGLLQGGDTERAAIVDHVDAADGRARILDVELGHRIDVADAEVVDAGANPRHRLAGAARGIELAVEAGVAVPAQAVGKEKGGGRSVKGRGQREADAGRGARAMRAQHHGHRQRHGNQCAHHRAARGVF